MKPRFRLVPIAGLLLLAVVSGHAADPAITGVVRSDTPNGTHITAGQQVKVFLDFTTPYPLTQTYLNVQGMDVSGITPAPSSVTPLKQGERVIGTSILWNHDGQLSGTDSVTCIGNPTLNAGGDHGQFGIVAGGVNSGDGQGLGGLVRTNSASWTYPSTFDVTIHSAVTPNPGKPGTVSPGDTVHYEIGATSSGATKITLETDVPAGTTLVKDSAGAGVVTGGHIEWTVTGQASATVSFDVKVLDGAHLSPKQKTIQASVDAAATFPADSATDGASDTLELAIVSLEIADANPDELGGIFLPDAKNAAQLPSFDWAGRRPVAGIAADGVAMLVLRAKTRVKTHGRFRIRVAETAHGAEPGSVWAPADTSVIDASVTGGSRDTMPAGPSQIDVDPVANPGVKGETLGFALYRAPRNFDIDGLETYSLQSRPVTLTVDLLDAAGSAVIGSQDFELQIVRPLVLLQHGTFDSPAGWVTSDLHTQTGNELNGYQGFTDQFPFQTDRGNFSTFLDASGPLLGSAPVAWAAMTAAFDNWRKTTGYAGAQMDVVCHSYGGVNMRWIAQSQTSPSPVSLNSVTNFRNAKNWGHGSFHKLITIATTHRGSAVGNHLAFLNANGVQPGLMADAAASQSSWIDRGAVEDQMVVSPRLRQLQRTFCPGHAIAGSGLCDNNKNYEKRLYMLWKGDAEGGPFASLGVPYPTHTENADFAVFRRMSNHGFNLSQTLQDDVSQDPNYDLTVSSYSSKGGMPREAQTTIADFDLLAVGGSLAGRMTHGDEIADGSGDRTAMDAVAMRVGFLLRRATGSQYFANFPAAFSQLLTPTEQAFSDPLQFDPRWLYLSLVKSAPAGPRKSAAPPTMTVVSAGTPGLPAKSGAGRSTPRTTPAPATLVTPGEELTLTISSGEVPITGGFVTWAGETAGTPGMFDLEPGTTVGTLVVPNRRPGPFGITGYLYLADGTIERLHEDTELVDVSGYDDLRAEPSELVIRGADPASVNVHGHQPGGPWRSVDLSPRLVLVSSDPGVVSVGTGHRLQPVAPGTATVTATYDGTITATVSVTVTGETVGVLVAPSKKRKLKAGSRGVADFVFLSGPNFDPSSIVPADVRIGGVPATKTKRKKDYNGDGVPDFVAYVSPRALGVVKGAATISLFATLADGTRVGGRGTATVK